MAVVGGRGLVGGRGILFHRRRYAIIHCVGHSLNHGCGAMAKLTQQRLADLEELTLQIPNQIEKQYFDEAVQCYFIGALRASIILGWIVATDNLTGKLELLAKEDGEAKKKWNAIQSKRANDEAFEEDLFNAFGPGSLDVFSSRQIQQLQYVRRIRNWCAHATDYQPTAEEVRHCLRLLVDIALATPTYRGYRYIAQLSEQVKDSSFLPERDYSPIISDILAKLRPGLYKSVAERLVEMVLDNTSTPNTINNAKKFLGGMLLNISDEMVLQATMAEIKRLISEATDAACDVISHRPDVFRMCDYQERERIIRHLLNDGYSSSRQEFLRNLVRTELIINKEPESIIKQLEDKFTLVPSIVKEFSTEFAQGVFEKLIPDLEYDGFNNFSVNNEAAGNLQKLGLDFFDVISDADKVRMVKAIIRGAINGSHGPNEVMSKPRYWPGNWLRILVTEIPNILSLRKKVVDSPSFIADPLLAWAELGEPLPGTWESALKVGENFEPNWYVGESWKLHESMQNVRQTFEKNGHPSPELERFLAELIPF
jgi:hypothetical protein